MVLNFFSLLLIDIDLRCVRSKKLENTKKRNKIIESSVSFFGCHFQNCKDGKNQWNCFISYWELTGKNENLHFLPFGFTNWYWAFFYSDFDYYYYFPSLFDFTLTKHRTHTIWKSHLRFFQVRYILLYNDRMTTKWFWSEIKKKIQMNFLFYEK